MDLIRRFQAGRHAKKLQGSETHTGAALADARAHLLSIGAAAIPAIFDALANSPPTAATLDVLEHLLDDDSLTCFTDALRDKDTRVVECAAAVLGRAKGYDPTQLLALFADASISKARLESIMTAQIERVQAATLMRVLPDLSKEARTSIYRLIERRGDPSIVQDAIALTTHAEWWLRLHAVKLLARFPREDGIAAVAKALKDENSAVRLEAVRSLGALQAASAVPALCARLRDPDIKVQTATIEVLIQLADVASVPHLLEHLKDESEYVRRGAVEVLNQVVTVDAIKDLVSALRDSDWWVRVRAADALGTLGGTRVIDAVISLIHDPDDFIRRYAVEILNTVPDRRAVPPLIEALEDADWWVRERAIDALAKTGDARAVEPLVRMLGRDPRSIPLCVKALSAIGDPSVVEPLCRLAGSESAEIRREAIHGLTALAKKTLPPDTRAQLLQALESAGVQADRIAPTPLEVRNHHGPETGRVDTSHYPQTPPTGVPGVQQGAHTAPGGAPRQLNFQKLEPGTVLSERYRVLQRIGGGGFGTVYLVEDVIVREEMVLKVLSPQLSMDENMIRRFVQELKLTRRIAHPNVIRIYDLLDLESAHAISMEFFKGRDLGSVLKQDGPMSVDRVLVIIEQVLEGLAAAHEMGIIHRDIKPANILLADDGKVKIVDFGLASVGQTAKSRLTQSGILVGTPEYISPEQITGHDVDGRTDLYSLGVVMYELLSGKQAFSGTNAVNVLFQHLESEVPPLSSVAAGIPAPVNELVMRSMSRFANDRPQNATVMLEMLRRAV